MAEREEARQEYEQAKAEGRKASLLEQDRTNIFTVSVSGILPDEDAKIEIEYQQALRYDSGEFSLELVKLGRDNDKEIVDTIREMTDKPLRVDVNQGWTDREHALRMCEWLATRKVEFVEQPMPKEKVDDIAWLRSKSPLPILFLTGS